MMSSDDELGLTGHEDWRWEGWKRVTVKWHPTARERRTDCRDRDNAIGWWRSWWDLMIAEYLMTTNAVRHKWNWVFLPEHRLHITQCSWIKCWTHACTNVYCSQVSALDNKIINHNQLCAIRWQSLCYSTAGPLVRLDLVQWSSLLGENAACCRKTPGEFLLSVCKLR